MKKVLLSLLVLAAVVVIGVLVFAEVRYGAVRGAAPAPHTRFVTDATRGQIVIRPLMARNLFDAWIPSERKPPTWLLTRTLPHELAFVFSPDMRTGETDLVLYINEQRFGPVVADLVNQAGIMGQYDYMRWNADGLKAEERGTVRANGVFSIPMRIVALARQHWGIVQGIEPLEIEGNHFFEAVFDNRDGGAFALMCALYDYGVLGEPQAPLEDEYETFLPIASIRVQADATSSGEVQLIVVLESTPGARAADIDANAFYLEVAIGEIARVLRETYGAELRGRAYTEGATVTGRYTVRNVSGIIAALLSAN